ncbi:dienelactone hydrolase family protein [Methylomonas sp. MED-D]|uniref:dienelactone hydrolase family protein n=1 Tax=Methylomonas sp. MED-D TaxID=3418768 RepID=UPI003CFBEF63
MARQTANDFHPEALKKFDEYVHGDISRREFLSSVPKYALLGLTAEALLDALNPRFAQAQQVAGNDPRIKTSYLEYPSPQGNGKVRGYLAQPANAKGKLPVVLVIHENRGLNPHIEDIARRLALDNFIAFAPDALFTLGGYPGDEDKARELFQKLDKAKTQNDFLAAAQAMKKLPGGNGKLGAVGFCYGGGIVNFLATRLPDLSAGVPFYGAQPPAEDVAKIKGALLIHYAGVDDRINAGWPAFEAALQKAGTNYEAHTYAGVQHGFNNDTTPRYDAGTAKLAWDRTVAFFNAYLRDS